MSEQTDPQEAGDEATTDLPPRGATAGIIFRMKAKSRSFEALCSACVSILQRLGRLKAHWRGSPSFRRRCWLSLALVVVAVPLFAVLFWYVDEKFLGLRYTAKWRKQRLWKVREEFQIHIGGPQLAELCQVSPAGVRAEYWTETAWTDGPYVEVPGFYRPTDTTVWFNATSASGEYSCTGRYRATVTAVIRRNDPLGMPYQRKGAAVDNVQLLQRLTRPAERAGAITVLPGECHVHAIDADRDHQLERYLVDVPAGRRLYVTVEPDVSVHDEGGSGEPLLTWRVVRPTVRRVVKRDQGDGSPYTYVVAERNGTYEIEVERNILPATSPWSAQQWPGREPRYAYGFRVTWGPASSENCPSIEASCELLSIADDARRCPLRQAGSADPLPVTSSSISPPPD